jgi:hypothetical protein
VGRRVAWGECDLRRDPPSTARTPPRLVRTDTVDQGGGDAPPATALDAFARYARGLQLDLKVLPGVLDEVLALVQRHEFEDDRLWFNASIAAVGAEGFRRSWAAHPGAIVQCPVDFLEPLALAAPRRARAVLQMLAGWGISRFSVAWAQDTTLSSVQALHDWG